MLKTTVSINISISIIFLFININVSKAETEKERLEKLDAGAQYQNEINLINHGVIPEVAKWGAWAMHHQPGSQCGIRASFIAGGLTIYDDEVAFLERSNLCSPQALRADAKNRRPSTPLELENENIMWGIKWDYSVLQPILPRGQKAKLIYPPEYEEEEIEGSVTHTCHFYKKKDNLWYSDRCTIISYEGGTQFINATLDYFSRAAWSDQQLPGKLDKNGNSTLTTRFNLQ